MKKSKILISAVTMFSLCITPMSVYAQVDPNSNIENTISQTKSAENLLRFLFFSFCLDFACVFFSFIPNL